MDDQDRTYAILRRIPYEEMDDRLKNDISKTSPVFHLGGNAFESRKHEIVRHYERMRLMERYGWDFESFTLETEKRNIISAIKQYNSENTFPQELVDRAKEFFPNARFIQASIELE